MDRFKSYNDLCRHAVEGRDFIVETRRGASALAVMAPHGGSIEPGTDTLASAIAGCEHGYYAFKGVRDRNNADLRNGAGARADGVRKPLDNRNDHQQRKGAVKSGNGPLPDGE